MHMTEFMRFGLRALGSRYDSLVLPGTQRAQAKAHELRHVHAVVREEKVLLERVDLDAGVVLNALVGSMGLRSTIAKL